MHMATTKTRVNVTLSPDVEHALFALAKRDQVPHATKAAELLRTALEIDEDIVLDAVARERDTRGGKYISHHAAWK